MSAGLTPARARALLVVNEAELEGTKATESNATRMGRDGEGFFVYWQSRAWLEAQGLITSRGAAGRLELSLTPAGRALKDKAKEVALANL